MRGKIKVLKLWLQSDDNSVEKLREIRIICVQIAYDLDDVYAADDAYAYAAAADVFVDTVVALCVAVDARAAVTAVFDAYHAAVSVAYARKKVNELIQLLEKDR